MKITVAIVTFSLTQGTRVPLSNLVRIFSRIAERVYIVTGSIPLDNLSKNVQVMTADYKASSKLFMKIINYMHTQLKILRHVVVISRKTDLFVFFLEGEFLFAPMLALKLLRKRVVLMPAGVETKVYSIKMDPLSKFLSLVISFNFSLADKLILYSRMLIREANLAKYHRKVITAHEHLVDFTKFTVKKKIDERLNVVGYIGRLSEEKRILSLIEAMPLVLKKRADTRFVICGKGSLADEVEKIVKADGLETHVKLTGWVPHEDVPRYLEEFKLLVLPSFTEGLPNVLLEAMACGTPVLATRVGAIPDVVEEGETGFFLKTINPEHIADRITQLLGRPDLLVRVSENAHKQVLKNFSYEKTLRSWRKVFRDLEV